MAGVERHRPTFDGEAIAALGDRTEARLSYVGVMDSSPPRAGAAFENTAGRRSSAI